MDRKNRLKEAYKYLQSIGKIHTQKGFADALGKAEGTISRAFNGDEKALTDNLFVQITLSFPGLFNLDYLLTGEGSLLMLPDKSVLDGMEKFQKEIKRWSESDEVKQMRETMEAMRQTIESYQTAIRAQNELIARLKKELNQSYPNPGIFASDDMVNLTTKPNPKQEK